MKPNYSLLFRERVNSGDRLKILENQSKKLLFAEGVKSLTKYVKTSRKTSDKRQGRFPGEKVLRPENLYTTTRIVAIGNPER